MSLHKLAIIPNLFLKLCYRFPMNKFKLINSFTLPPSAAFKMASLIEGEVSVTLTTYFSSSKIVSTVSFASASHLLTIYVSSLATI